MLLDFWTYRCINCIHVVPELKRLEEKYPELIVIGVHSAKFVNEHESANIEEAILKYDLRHPVIVDSEFKVWDAYSINAWPSFSPDCTRRRSPGEDIRRGHLRAPGSCAA